MNYKGSISGIGNSSTRENEITADNVAAFRNFAIKHKSGVVYDVGHDFYATVDGFVNVTDDGKTQTGRYSNTVHITDGFMFAYGYFAYAPAVDFTFLPPAVEQWHIIYVELDKSVIPNTCIIKTKNNQGSGRVLQNTFRQDELSVVKTGVFQLPLWAIRVTNKGVEVEDLRTNEYKNPQGRKYDLRTTVRYIKNVVHSDHTSRVNGIIPNSVVCETQPQGTNNQTVANREFVIKEIQESINK